MIDPKLFTVEAILGAMLDDVFSPSLGSGRKKVITSKGQKRSTRYFPK